MKKLLVLSLVLVSCLVAKTEILNIEPFTRHCEVTFSGYEGTTALTNFPALVRIPKGSLLYEVSCDGNDVRFSDIYGNLLPSEVDYWDVNGESLLWVQVPCLEGKTTKVNLYAGGMSLQSTCSDQVWGGADFRAVWHFSGNYADSSTNHLSGSNHNATFNEMGKLGTAYRGNGSNTYVEFTANNYAWCTNFENGLTLSAWVKSKVANGCNRIISCKDTYSNTNGFELTQQNSATSITLIGREKNQVFAETGPNIMNDFVYVTATFKDGVGTVYENGVKILDKSPGFDIQATFVDRLRIGAKGSRSPNWTTSNYWNGWIDELRMATWARSLEWIQADYATQSKSDFAVLSEVIVKQVDTDKIDATAFSQRCLLSVTNTTGISETLCHFPVLVRVPHEIAVQCVAGGVDVRFTDEDGVILDHEIDCWDLYGQACAWVRLPRLRPQGEKIWMYFGGKPLHSENTRRVWQGAQYRGVWHFTASGNDSSTNNYNMTFSSETPDCQREGPVGTTFWATNGYCYVANNPGWATNLEAGLTVSCWAKTFDPGACRRIISAKAWWMQLDGFELTIQNAHNSITAGGSTNLQIQCSTAPSLTNYVYITAVYQGNEINLYANGNFLQRKIGGGDLRSAGGILCIGASGMTGTAVGLMNSWHGGIDEVRLRTGGSNAAWIQTDYATQTDTNFVTFAECEELTAKKYLNIEDFHRCATITFSGYKGSSTLYNFPALIRIPAGSAIYKDCKADGSDIRFAGEDGLMLPHEFDVWNKAGESCIWVRIPELSNDCARVYMYYRSSTLLENTPSDVWAAAGYRGVWHMNEAKDSSPNAFTTANNGIQFIDNGIVGKAFYSSGSQYLQISNNPEWANLEGRDVTLSAWVKTDRAYPLDYSYFDRIISSKYDHKEREGFELTVQNDGRYYNAIGAWNHQHIMGPYANCALDYVYVSAVMHCGTIRIYLNGEFVGNPNNAHWSLKNAVSPLRIGKQNSANNNWVGKMDEVRLQWASQSADWVAADYATQKGGLLELGEPEIVNALGSVIMLR